MKINAKIKMAFFLVFASLGSPSVSAEDDLPYPPTYFSKFRIDLAVAQDVAENCKGIEIDR